MTTPPSHSETVVFLDRDGTINRNYEEGPVYQLARFELLPGAAEGIRLLNDLGLRVLVATNQGGIRHRDRDFDWATYRQIEERMHRDLAMAADAHVDGVYVCEHASYEACACRKPKTGLFERALRDHPFEASRSFMVGDSTADIVAGSKFGLQTLLVTSGWKCDVADELIGMGYRALQVLPDLQSAAAYIAEEVTQRGERG